MPDRIGRNDPCPCGSGKKYKRCCMARDKAAQAERVAWDHAARDIRVALIRFAQEGDFIKDLALGLSLFWQDRYTVDTVHMMGVDESLRFFDWFAHDYTLQAVDSPGCGQRLVEVYRHRMGHTLSQREAVVLDEWIESLPGSAFILERTDPGQGTSVIRDLFLPDRTLTVHDMAAAVHGEMGQILLARPLPERQRMCLAGATVVLPSSEEEGLRAFIGEAYRSYLDSHPGAALDIGPHDMVGSHKTASPHETMGLHRTDMPSDGEEAASLDEGTHGGTWTCVSVQFLREQAYLLTHYALEWAEREGRPATLAQDPEARRPGSKPLQKLIQWRRSHVQVR